MTRVPQCLALVAMWFASGSVAEGADYASPARLVTLGASATVEAHTSRFDGGDRLVYRNAGPSGSSQLELYPRIEGTLLFRTAGEVRERLVWSDKMEPATALIELIPSPHRQVTTIEATLVPSLDVAHHTFLWRGDTGVYGTMYAAPMQLTVHGTAGTFPSVGTERDDTPFVHTTPLRAFSGPQYLLLPTRPYDELRVSGAVRASIGLYADTYLLDEQISSVTWSRGESEVTVTDPFVWTESTYEALVRGEVHARYTMDIRITAGRNDDPDEYEVKTTYDAVVPIWKSDPYGPAPLIAAPRPPTLHTVPVLGPTEPALELGVLAPDTHEAVPITLRSEGATLLEIDATLEMDGAEVDGVHQLLDPLETRVVPLYLPTGGARDGIQHAAIVLLTSDPARPAVRIPVQFTVEDVPEPDPPPPEPDPVQAPSCSTTPQAPASLVPLALTLLFRRRRSRS